MTKMIFLTLIILIPIYCFSQNNVKTAQKVKSGKIKEFCGTVYNNSFDKSNCVLSSFICAYPASRDSFIPNALTNVKYISLLIIVVDSNFFGVTQENIDFMITGLSNYFYPWKIEFCYSTVFIDSSMLSQYPQNSDSVINVIISDWSTLGLSGNPIKIDYSVVTDNNYKGAYALAHELGHNFKLSHTSTTIEFVSPSHPQLGCTYSCRDRVDYPLSIQDTVGDKMSDTPPTPLNYNCAPPSGVDSCSGNQPWPAWGYENLMGYSFCPNATFTPQQAGRMHCFINYGQEGNIIQPQKLIAYANLHCNPNSITDNTINDISFEIIPNPFKESTAINFKVPEEGVVSIEVYNYLGQKISDIFNEMISKDQQKRIEFFTNNLSSGIYYAKLKSENKILIKKMVVTK